MSERVPNPKCKSDENQASGSKEFGLIQKRRKLEEAEKTAN